MTSYLYQQLNRLVTPIYNKIIYYFPLYGGQIQAVRYLILLTIMIYTALVNTSMNPSVVQEKVFVGLAQPQLCVEQSYTMYYVGSRGLFNGIVTSDDIINKTGDSNIISNPIVYEITDSSAYNQNPSELSKYSKPCINMWHLSQCESTLENTEFLHQTVSMFTNSFDVPEHDYFPFIDAIIFSCMTSVYLIVYTGTHQELQGQRKVTYISDIIGALLCFFIFQSASTHTIIYTEDCESIYPASFFSKGPNICTLLSGCELVLKSVLDVRDDISQYYSSTLYTLGSIWATFLATHITCNLIYEYHCYTQEGVERRLQEEHDNILNKTGDALNKALEEVSLEFINHYIKDWKYHPYFCTYSNTAIYTRSIVNNSTSGSGSSGGARVNNRDTVAIPVESTDDQLDKAECSICLSLLLTPIQQSSSRDTPNTIRSDTATYVATSTTDATSSESLEIQNSGSSRASIMEMTSLSHFYRSSVGAFSRSQYVPVNQAPMEVDENGIALTSLSSTTNEMGQEQEQIYAKVIQLKCSHLFHQTCILQWVAVNRNSICPVCRQPLRPEPLQ